MYVTSRICQTFGKSTQSRTPNAYLFSPLGAYPTPLSKNFGVGEGITLLQLTPLYIKEHKSNKDSLIVPIYN